MDSSSSKGVFINCPFDARYKRIFEAIIFAVSNCGFEPLCSLETDDGGQTRIEKIFDLIARCKFGIHDLSRTELDEVSGLPRFNMPLELGLFLGAKRYGSKTHREKACLILDRERFRYQQFISDISGHDIQAHADDPRAAIAIVRDWLRKTNPKASLPGGEAIANRYETFRSDLPGICRDLHLDATSLTVVDYKWLIFLWQQIDVETRASPL